LNKIDPRFQEKGIPHLFPQQFIPINDLVNNFDKIKIEIDKVVRRIREESENK